MKQQIKRVNQEGFTLTELLVALVIVMILMSTAIVSYKKYISMAVESAAIKEIKTCLTLMATEGFKRMNCTITNTDTITLTSDNDNNVYIEGQDEDIYGALIKVDNKYYTRCKIDNKAGYKMYVSCKYIGRVE